MFLRLLMAAALCAAFTAPVAAQETLVVYWTKGFYPQEDKALDDMVAKFEKKTGVKVELSRYSPQESVPKAVAALDSGSPPDGRTATCSISRSRASGPPKGGWKISPT